MVSIFAFTRTVVAMIGEAHGLGEDGGACWRTAPRRLWEAADELKVEKLETMEAVEQVAADGPSGRGLAQ